MDPIYEYFIKPIEEKTGYNPINTLTYAILAIFALYVIYHWFKKEKIDFSDLKEKVLPFVIFGSIKRVITDAVDHGVLSGFPYSLYEYNFWNVSPGIYITVAIVFLITYYIEKKWKIKATLIGWFLAGVHFVLLLPALKFWVFAFPALALALLPTVLVKPAYRLPMFAQALDGAATFIAVEFLGYGEQHVLTKLLGTNLGYFSFYLLKIALTYIILKFSEKDEMKDIIWTAITVIGLAPGLRDLLRMVAYV